MLYPLPTTTILPQLILDTQKHITSLFLSKMGYSQNMPWSIVYAPESVGGLGLRHLGVDQGIQQVLHLIKHIWYNTTNGKLYTITVDSYQLTSGLSTPILEDTRPIPWIPDGWISCICSFLHTTSSKIHLKQPWTPVPWRNHDQCLMGDIIQEYPPDKAAMFNNIWLYLCINKLSEITHANGTTILDHMLEPSATPAPSMLQWPHQPKLPTKAWKAWKLIIQELYLKPHTDLLMQLLGSWHLHQALSHWQWDWQICPSTLTLYHYTGQQWELFKPRFQWCKYVIYDPAGMNNTSNHKPHQQHHKLVPTYLT